MQPAMDTYGLIWSCSYLPISFANLLWNLLGTSSELLLVRDTLYVLHEHFTVLYLSLMHSIVIESSTVQGPEPSLVLSTYLERL